MVKLLQLMYFMTFIDAMVVNPGFRPIYESLARRAILYRFRHLPVNPDKPCKSRKADSSCKAGQSALNYIARKQLAFKHGNLRVDDAGDVQLTAASKRKVLRQVRECFRVRRIFECGHKDQQRARLRCRFITSATNDLR